MNQYNFWLGETIRSAHFRFVRFAFLQQQFLTRRDQLIARFIFRQIYCFYLF